MPLECYVTGTDTGIGKTRVVELLVVGLRRLGRRVWVHKPVACGGWDGRSSEDGRRLRALVGDGQDPATCCPREWPAEASPHLAAAAAGTSVGIDELAADVAALRGDHDLLVEGAGGLLSPLSAGRGTLADLAERCPLPFLIVASSRLGTLNHSSLTAALLRARGREALGIVLSHARPEESRGDAAVELPPCTGLPLLAELAHAPGADPEQAEFLARAVLGRHHAAPER